MQLREPRSKVPPEHLEENDSLVKPYHYRGKTKFDESWEEGTSQDASSSFADSAFPSEVIDLTDSPKQWSRKNPSTDNVHWSDLPVKLFTCPGYDEYEEEQRRGFLERRKKRREQAKLDRANAAKRKSEEIDYVMVKVHGGIRPRELIFPKGSPETRIRWTPKKVRMYLLYNIGFRKSNPLDDGFAEEPPSESSIEANRPRRRHRVRIRPEKEKVPGVTK